MLPILVALLLFGLVNFVIDSLKIVSETNRNNFIYTVKLRDSLSQIDTIVEGADTNLNVFSGYINDSYDIEKLYSKKYNDSFVHNLDFLTKSVLINSPGVDGAWFQLNYKLPFSSTTYSWYGRQKDKVVDVKAQLENNNIDSGRPLSTEDDPYYFQAIKAKKTIWTSVYQDADTKVPMLSIARSIYKNDILVGVVGVDISVNNVQKILKNMQAMFEGSEIFLLNNDKKIIVSQLEDDRSDSKRNYAFIDLFKKKVLVNQEMVEYFDLGVRKTALLLPLSNSYGVVITFPNSLIYKGFDSLFKTIYFVLAILIVLAVVTLFNRVRILKINANLEKEKTILRTIIDAAPSLVVVKDINGFYIECNRKFLELKCLKREEFLGKTDYDLFDPFEIDEILQNDKIVIETKKLLVKESYHLSNSGVKLYVEKYIVPLLDYNGNVAGICVVAYDITKRHQIQMHLQQAKEDAEKASMMKSSFLANMSHEIRTPLNGVLGFLQLLEDTNPSVEQKDFIADAQVSAEILIQIINEILDFSKIEAGKLKTDNISFDVRSVVEDVTVVNISSAYKKGLDLSSLICSDVPQNVFGDPSRVKQILNNLVSNAIKFTQEGDVAIYVNLVSQDSENATITFSVKDTGIGIPNDKFQLIFDSFSQADVSTTRKYGGTGLGLSISQKLAELMGGRISLESKIGEGSVFTVTLPFKVDTRQPENIDNTYELLKGSRVLFVSKAATDLKIINYYLSEMNCIVKEASTHEDAMRIINEEPCFSTIIVDYNIQNMTDVKLSTIVKSNPKCNHTPLILFTEIGLSGGNVQSKEQGFFACLTKPLKKRDLLDTIKAAICKNNDATSNDEILTKHTSKERKFDSKTRILLVEDTELNCKFALKLLAKAGLSCDVAHEGKSAIDAFKTKNYGLIFMDCQMPVMDGFEATREIRRLEGGNSHIPIIAMTANVMQSDRQQCMDAGMDDFIGKPLDVEALFALMAKYLPLKDEFCLESVIKELTVEVGFTEEEAFGLFVEFKEFLAQSVSEIDKALDTNDFDSIKIIAHKLKGTSANLGLKELSKMAFQLEKLTREDEIGTFLQVVGLIKDFSEMLKKSNQKIQ